MTEPSFIDRDGGQILADMTALYEQISGKVLQPAQAERLLINAFAYRELLLREQVQYAALQTLVSFASAPALDYLGELVGVYRLSASAATTTIQFSLIAGHGGVVIPEGTRVATSDGKVIFATTEATDVNAGVLTADVQCFTTALGESGNGYTIGEVNEILDPQPFLTGASNLDITAGGANQETDDVLRERIKLAPEAFSTAGSEGAYKFHAKSASPAILDVAVTSPTPGEVNIYPLTATLPTAPSILALVDAACNSEKVRPLTDTVTVLTPTSVAYDITVEVECYNDANTVTVQEQIEANLAEYAAVNSKRLGLDIVRSQIIAKCMVEGVYDVTIVEPATDIVIAATEVPQIGAAASVTITGLVNG